MLGLQQSEKKENKVKNFLEQPKKLLWSKTSWQQFVALHQPIYQDKKLLDNCLSQLNELPNLVHSLEIEQLKNHIAEGGRGQEFLLQCGDCAEQFKDCHPQIVANKIDLIFQLKKILEPQLKKKLSRLEDSQDNMQNQEAMNLKFKMAYPFLLLKEILFMIPNLLWTHVKQILLLC